MATDETRIDARWIAPVEPDETTVLEHHSLVLRDGRIHDILPIAEARQRYPDDPVTELDDHVVIPGLVNAHTHAAMTLLRGLADDLPLGEWLAEHMWPAESRWVSPAFLEDGARLAIAEMLRGGTTCFNDMYFFPDVVARCAVEEGIRACVGMIVLDFATPWAGSPDEYLAKGLEVHDAYKHHPLVTTAFAPHAPYTVSDEPLSRIRTYADELDCPVHIHVHETAAEVEEALAETGRRPLTRLDELGLVTPSLLAVHATALTPTEIARLAEAGAHVVHCPESNMKLASGFCRAAALDAAGVNLALGTDGAASNNDLDMLGEMRSAALLSKAVAGDATALPAPRALRMATLDGARALGLADDCGSLAVGKWADITAVRLGGPECQPLYNPISQLVYSAGRADVSDVWVAGRHLVRGGALTHLDIEGTLQRSHGWRERIARGDAS